MARLRSGDVRQSKSISSRSRRVTSASAAAPGCPASSATSSALIRRSDSVTARLRASVGCAVSTGCTSSRPISASW